MSLYDLVEDEPDVNEQPDQTDDTVITRNVTSTDSGVVQIQDETGETKEAVKDDEVSFESLGISTSTLDLIYQKFDKPTSIQAFGIPPILQGKNFIGQAKSGTGKTLTFAVGMLEKCDPSVEEVQALCIVPTRELAIQIYEVLGMFNAKGLGVRLAVPQAPQEENNSFKHIIVGTTGSILDLERRRAFSLNRIRIFVLDEADSFFMQQDSHKKVEIILNKLPGDVQILLFSATYPDTIAKFVESKVPNPLKLFLKPDEISVDKMYQTWIRCENRNDKFANLLELYRSIDQTQCIIFVNSVKFAQILKERLTKEGFNVSVIYGRGMSPEQRDKIMKEFKTGETRVLISTNVLSRGIDVLQVGLVVNYDVPFNQNREIDLETYVHRVGRTARAERFGVAITFVDDRRTFDELMYLRDKLNIEIEEIKTDRFGEINERINKAN